MAVKWHVPLHQWPLRHRKESVSDSSPRLGVTSVILLPRAPISWWAGVEELNLGLGLVQSFTNGVALGQALALPVQRGLIET